MNDISSDDIGLGLPETPAHVDLWQEATFAPEFADIRDILRDRLYREKPVAGRRPRLGDAIPKPGIVVVQPLPVTPRYQPLTRAGILALLQPVVSADEFRPALSGVSFDGTAHLAVATDGFVLVAIPYRAALSDRGKIVDPRDGTFIDEVFPPWRKVVRWSHAVESINLNSMMAAVKGVMTANKFFDTRDVGIAAGITINGTTILFDPVVLMRALSALAGAGTGMVEIQYGSPIQPVIFRDATMSDRFALVMPRRAAPTGSTWSSVLLYDGPAVPPVDPVEDGAGEESAEDYGVAPV